MSKLFFHIYYYSEELSSAEIWSGMKVSRNKQNSYTDGTPVDWSDIPWHTWDDGSSDPNNYSGSGSCVRWMTRIVSNGRTLADKSCGSNFRFVCKYPGKLK